MLLGCDKEFSIIFHDYNVLCDVTKKVVDTDMENRIYKYDFV